MLALFLVLLLSLALGFVWNEDLWWYLASGETILEQGSIPEADIFLYTSNENTRFPSHSWLWSVLLVLWNRLLGVSGMVVFSASVAAAAITLVFCSARVDRFGLANGLFVALVMISAAERLSLKAEIASWLLLVVFFYILDRNKPFTLKTLGLLAVLQWLWSNLHAAYPLGMALALAYSVGGFLQAWWERRQGKDYTGTPPPLWTVPTLFVATLLTPEVGERLRIFYAGADITTSRLAGSGLSVAIDELQGTFAVEDPTFATLYLIALGASGFCWLRSSRGPLWLSRFFLLAGMAVLAYTAIRHVTPLVLVSALVGLSCLAERGEAPTKTPAHPLYLAATGTLAAVVLMATFGMVSLRGAFEFGQTSSGFSTLSPLAASPGAADYIREHRLPGPIFNDLILGGHLTHELYPEHQLFIDNRILRGRLNQEYVTLSTSAEAWKQAEARHGFRTAVLSNLAVPNHIPLRSILTNDPTWRRIYVDPAAVVFVKGAARSPVEDRLEGVDGKVPFATSSGGFGAWTREAAHLFFRTRPEDLLHQYLSVLGRLKLNREMVDLATQALEVRPDDARLFRNRGSARMLLGQRTEGVEDLEEAVRLDPDDAWNHFTHALALRDSGRPQEALQAVQRAVRMEPDNDRFEALRRRLAAMQGR